MNYSAQVLWATLGANLQINVFHQTWQSEWMATYVLLHAQHSAQKMNSFVHLILTGMDAPLGKPVSQANRWTTMEISALLSVQLIVKNQMWCAQVKKMAMAAMERMFVSNQY